MENLSDRIADFLIKSGNATEDIRDIIIFGVVATLSLLINFIFTLTIGFIFRMPLELTFFFISFSVLRVTSGGYHAKTFFGCVAMSLIVMLFVSAMLYIDIGGAIMPLSVLFILIAISVTFLLAPITHANHPMDQTSITRFRKCSRIAVICCSALCLGLFAIGSAQYMYCVSLGMLISAGSTLTSYFFKGKEDTRNEKNQEV